MQISLAADKGGVGKSTLAVHLAAYLARQLGDVALVDLDGRRTSSTWCDEPPAYAVYDMDTVTDRAGQHEHIIIDTPAHATGPMAHELARHDRVLVVAESDPASQVSAMSVYRRLAELGGRPLIVLNNIHPSADVSQHLAEFRQAGFDCWQQAVRRYACYERAQWDQRTIDRGFYPNGDKAWADIRALAEAVLVPVEEVAYA